MPGRKHENKTGLSVEAAAALLPAFLTVIGFALLMPVVLRPSVPVAWRMLFELSPYLLLLGMAALLCRLRGRPAAAGLGFSWAQPFKQLAAALIIFLITISLILLPLLLAQSRAMCREQR